MRRALVFLGVALVCADATADGRPPSALTLLRELYWDCFAREAAGAAEACVGGKVALAMDALLRARRIPVMGGLELVAEGGDEDARPLTREALDAALPRGESARADATYAVIAERMGRLLRTHSLRFGMAEGADESRGRGIRRIRKMLMPFLVGVVLKVTAFLPILLTSMAVLALKSLGASKLAIAITALLGLRRLTGNAGGMEPGAGSQIEKSYGLLGHAASAALPLDFAAPAHDLLQTQHAVFAHPTYYARAIGSTPAPAAA